MLFYTGEGFTGIGLPENDIFYFHPDHLGSTSYITTRNGSISQHVEYIAFGEVLFEEHSSSFSSPYLFNGKELDRETNLSYYGARYYDSKISFWLNIDPKKEKYPTYGAYVFSLNNPINFIDPDGRDVIAWLISSLKKPSLEPVNTYNKQTKTLINTITQVMKTNTGRTMISQFMKKGQNMYGYKAKENGKYSDVNLNIVQIDLKNEAGDIKFAFFGKAEGMFTITEVEGKLTFNLYAQSTDIDTFAHELFIHGGGYIDEIIEAYKKGGIDAANKKKEELSDSDKDHASLGKGDTKHKGVSKYKQFFKELLKIMPGYKEEVERNKESNTYNYVNEKK